MRTLITAWLAVVVAGGALAADSPFEKSFADMMDRSFQSRGLADKSRMIQTPLQKMCSQEKEPPAAVLASLAARQFGPIPYPRDGKFFGDWKNGEKIAVSGRGLTWTDKTLTGNGGGCYNCHQLAHQEISYGTLGPSLLDYGQRRGYAPEVVTYTWSKIWNAKILHPCSLMPRFGDAGILSEEQIKDLMAYLFDPESPVNHR